MAHSLKYITAITKIRSQTEEEKAVPRGGGVQKYRPTLETRKFSKRQPNITPKGTKEEQTQFQRISDRSRRGNKQN